MLSRVDRPIMVVPDRAAAAERWTSLLGAEHSHDDRVAGLGALRSSYRVGTGWVELLEPDGTGPAADALAARGPHLYAAGVTTDDVATLAGHLRACGIEVQEENGQAWIGFGTQRAHGLVVAINPDEHLEPVGLLDEFYEATNLVDSYEPAVDLYARIFGLDASAFCPIDSSHYGYDGTLTLFHPDRLHRFEVITPAATAAGSTDTATTMGRFFAKVGASLYMMFAESGRLDEIADRVEHAGLALTRERGSLFLHPRTLGGMMLGVSRPTLAWIWSGRPERVEPE